MTGLDVAFAAVGGLTLAAAALAVTSRQVIHAALWLVVSLGALAGCYLVLGAELVTPQGDVVELGGMAPDAPGYDLLGAVVGSEGTLGIATSVTVRSPSTRTTRTRTRQSGPSATSTGCCASVPADSRTSA